MEPYTRDSVGSSGPSGSRSLQSSRVGGTRGHGRCRLPRRSTLVRVGPYYAGCRVITRHRFPESSVATLRNRDTHTVVVDWCTRTPDHLRATWYLVGTINHVSGEHRPSRNLTPPSSFLRSSCDRFCRDYCTRRTATSRGDTVCISRERRHNPLLLPRLITYTRREDTTKWFSARDD